MGTAVSFGTLQLAWSPVPPAKVSPFPYLSPFRPARPRCTSLSNPRVPLTSPIPGPPPELGCRLYLHLPRQQQEEVERLLEVSGEPANGWRGLAGRLGYQAEAVETMARSPGPASALLRDWAVQEGSGATLRALADALAAMGREDVIRALSSPAEGCSVV